MNFIVGALVYHAEEPVAYKLFSHIMEGARSNYTNGLKGLYMKADMFFAHLRTFNPKLATHLHRLEGFEASMAIMEPMMSLFLNIIPLSLSADFLSKFFDEGWSFFYKFSLALFDDLTPSLLECPTSIDALTVLKNVYNSHF